MLNLASTDAARQMLIDYVNSNHQIDNSVHNTWQTELRNLGYPQGISGSPLRLVAVSNGSECASLQNAPPNELVLSIQGKASTRFLGDLVSQVAFPVATVFTGQPSFLLGILPGSTDLNIDLQVNHTSEGGGNRVYYNRMWIRKKVLWFIPVTINITNKSFNAPSNHHSYESFPGGVYNTGFDINSSSSQNWFYKYNISASHVPTFGFIPVTSALDIGRGAVTLTRADYTTKYIGASPPTGVKSSPFVNFITEYNEGSIANEIHTSIKQRNGDWIASEILAASTSSNNYPTAVNSTLMCADLSIVGPAHICPGVGSTFTILGVPSDAVVTWSGPGNIISLSNSQISLNTYVNGALTLTATVRNAGGTRQISKTLIGGMPYSVQIEAYCEEGCYAEKLCTIEGGVGMFGGLFDNILFWKVSEQPAFPVNLHYYLVNYEQGVYYQNQIPVTTKSGWLRLPKDLRLGDGQVLAYLSGGPCAMSYDSEASWDVTVVNCDNEFSRIAAYPNPANTELIVGYQNDNVSRQANGQRRPIDHDFEVKLLNSEGNILKQGRTEADVKRLSLPVADVPNGTYFLHIFQGENVIKKQIVIKH